MKRTSSSLHSSARSSTSSSSDVEGDVTQPRRSPQTQSLAQGQLPAAPLDVPADGGQAPFHPVPLLEQVNRLLETPITAQMEGPPGIPSTTQASVNRILSSVQTREHLEAAFKLLDAPWTHDAAGALSGALAALCMQCAFEDPGDMCAQILRLLARSHTDRQHQEAFKALLANADNLPLPALRALVALLQEREDVPAEMAQAREALLGRYRQREVEASRAGPRSASMGASATLLDQPFQQVDNTTAVNITGFNVQAGPGVQIIPLPHQAHPPLAEGQLFSMSLPELLYEDPGGLIINFAKPNVELLPPQANHALQRAREGFMNMALVNKQIYERLQRGWHPELAALGWCFRLNRFEQKLAETVSYFDCLLPSSDLQQALLELVAPDPHTAVALEHLPNAPQSRIDVLIKRLFAATSVSVIKGLVDALFGELAKQARLGDRAESRGRAFVDLKQFARRAIIATLRMPHSEGRSAILNHVCNGLEAKLPPAPLGECLIEMCIALRMSPHFANLRKQTEMLASRNPAVKPLEARLNCILEFLQSPAAASEEVVAAVLQQLGTAVFWGPSDFDPLLALADRAVLAPGAAASLSQRQRREVETAVTKFIVHACLLYKDRVLPRGSFCIGSDFWMDEIFEIRQFPIELLRRVVSQLDLRVRLMIVMQRRILPSDQHLFDLVRDLVSDNGVLRNIRLRVVQHWLMPLLARPGQNAALYQELRDMRNALQQPGIQHGA